MLNINIQINLIRTSLTDQVDPYDLRTTPLTHTQQKCKNAYLVCRRCRTNHRNNEPAMDAPDLPEDDEDPLPDIDSPEDIMPAPEADSTEESGPGGMVNSDDSSS